jgi:hypothetical protein
VGEPVTHTHGDYTIDPIVLRGFPWLELLRPVPLASLTTSGEDDNLSAGLVFLHHAMSLNNFVQTEYFAYLDV